MRFNGALTEDRFDQLTERLATASMSRRGAIGMIGGVFAGVVASTSFGVERAFAQPTQLPQQIYVVRHGEKPPEPAGPPFGVDVDGNRNQHSLSPTGWQRSGALTVLFSPLVAPKVGLRTPAALYATAYGDAALTKIHRPYETLLGLSRRLDIPIQWAALLGPEPAFADAVLSSGAEVGWSAMNTSGSRRSLRVFPPSTAPPSPACGRMTAWTSSGRLL